MKIALALIASFLSVVLVTENNRAVLQDPEEVPVIQKGIENNLFAEDNEKCLVCHGEPYFELNDTATGVTQKRLMCDDYFVERDEFYQSNHWSFACTDCHSYDFEIFPHPTSTRLEETYHCNDCHGYDEQYARYQFEEIQIEYEESIHAEIDGFSCWKCHDPHSYEINIRTSTNLEKTILYDNNICIECHANFDNFMLLTDREEIQVVDSHSWLPNQSAHFTSVRCIECHTEINENILVAHKLLPMDKAVKRCTECHSSDSRLLATLYKFQSKEFRANVGFVNGVIFNQSYVIGANRNIILNVLSFVIFAGIILVIAVHILFRIIRRD
ncbi:MAG: cytochrome c3 family protein [Bacteroidales bacterium]|nr:cytochrome c3 family protein [Bacteroidales bacterium]